VPFSNPVAGGLTLIRQALRSLGYAAGVSGWSINKDGSAEFSDATIRGKVIATGTGGARIVIDPAGTTPEIDFLSPDGSNLAFVNLVSGAPSQAQLGINSGKYDPGDGVRRYFRLFAADNNIVAQVIRESNQHNFGGFIQWVQHAITMAIQDTDGGTFTRFQINDDGSMTLTTDSGLPVLLKNGGIIVPTGSLINDHSNVANTATATEAKDVIGDSSFTAIANRRYTFKYIARADSIGGTANIDFRVRGNNSAVSPTTASNILAGASLTTVGAGGGGASQLICEQTRVCRAVPAADEIAPGLWTVAPFFARVAGTAATVVADQATGQFREFRVDEVGGT